MHRSPRCGRRVLWATLGTAALAAVPAQAAAAGTQPVKLRFASVAGSTPVACGRLIDGLGTTNQQAELQDLRFYVSNVKLLRRHGRAVRVALSSGTRYQTSQKGQGVTLIDLENAQGACKAEGTPGTNALVRGTVPRGTYTGVQFTVGVPFAMNHTDTVSAHAPLNLEAMSWSWQYGRKFMKVELGDPGGATGSWSTHAFLVHLGSTGCTGNPASGQAVSCSAPNMPSVVLKHFDPRHQAIAFDLKAFVAGDDITVNRADEPGCMSGPTDPECGSVFGALGLTWQADGQGSGRSTGAQDVFRAIKS